MSKHNFCKIRERISTERVLMSTTLVHNASQNLTDILHDIFLHDDQSTALMIDTTVFDIDDSVVFDGNMWVIGERNTPNE